MAYTLLQTFLQNELVEIESGGLLKSENLITTAQGCEIETGDGETINFCANNYLGLANHPAIIEAAAAGLREHGFGMASVRFICGTQDIHKELEARISAFLKTEDTILYSSCFDANTGLFETILGAEDAIISDALNHASIIDGIRLCKAQRKVYAHADMKELEEKLQETADARFRLIVTDGVFSMQGDLAPLPEICDLAERYDALIVVDDSHATGFIGATGRGTPEYFGVTNRVDIITGTLGKAMGGASGGFTTGKKEIIEYLRQRSRPYLFSNALAPPIVMASLKVLELLETSGELIETLAQNTRYFRHEMTSRGFAILPGFHPIVPILLGDERRAVEMAREMKARGVFVVGFTFPVVPRGQARIRVQISAAHTREQLDRAIEVFESVGREMAII